MDLLPIAASMNPKVRDKGSIFECAAAYLSLKVIQRYRYDIGHVLRQSWANSSSCNPIDDLRGLIVEYDEKGELGCDSAYFISGPTMTSKDVRDLALSLASCYKNEFIALFGDKEAYKAEMKSLENDEKYISSILPTVLARSLLCPIILHLPDKGKPIYFYPYPIKEGTALPQFGDYSRPPMRLTLWSHGQYSLLMPINYSDEFVDNSLSPLLKDGGNGKGEDGEGEDRKDAEEKKGKKVPFKVNLQMHKYKNKLEAEDGRIMKAPTISLYQGPDKKKYDAAIQLREPLRKLLEKEYPPKDGIVYKMSDLKKLADREGVSTCTAIAILSQNTSSPLKQLFSLFQYFKLRTIVTAPSSASSAGDPLFFLRYGQYLPKGHLTEKKYEPIVKLEKSGNQVFPRISTNAVRSYRNKSVACVHELAENKLKRQIESSSLTDFFESHAVDYPTMVDALGNVNLFHATAVSASNGELLPLDVQYLNCIPKANGPYVGNSNSGDQMSGKDWLEKLPPDMRDKVEDLHGQYVIMPAWMLPMSALAVTSHMKLKDIHSSRVYFGKDPIEALLFHRFKRERPTYTQMRRHSVALVPRQLSIESRFSPVGDNSQGCDLLAKSPYPIPVDKL